MGSLRSAHLGLLLFAGTLTAACLSTGCTFPGGIGRLNSSHFTYPNSNVYPRGTVTGTDRKLCGVLGIHFGAPSMDQVDKALAQALQSDPEADMLINAQYESKTFTAFVVAFCNVKVSGTAAKMVVGEQDIGVAGGGVVPLETGDALEGGISGSCLACEDDCSGLQQQCDAVPGARACQLAQACLCQCKLDSGGCGEEPAALQLCVDSAMAGSQ